MKKILPVLAAFYTWLGTHTHAQPSRLVPVNGVVYAAVLNTTTGILYIGGDFTAVNATFTGGSTALSTATGLPDMDWPMVNGTVYASVPDGAGGWYIGGDFTQVGGITRNRIAHINAAKSVTGWNPDANGTVNALALSGSTVYVGGLFTNVGGQPRSRIAALDAATGTATTWNPNASGTIITLALSGSTVYAGGIFTSIGGQPRNRIAALDAVTGTATGWNPGANGAVHTLALSGSTVYAGGDFTTIADVTRNRIAALDAATGTATTWNPDASGTINTLALSGSTVYAGGSFISIGGQSRNRIAALDAVTGTATGWNPNANGEVYTLALSGSTVYAGGIFTTIAGVTRNRIAALDAATGTATGWNPNASSIVYTLALSGSTVYAGGIFTTIAGVTRNRIAALDAATGTATGWNPNANDAVLRLALNGSTVYVAGWFASIGGQLRNRIAALDAATGTATGWNPNANNTVRTLAVSGSTVYVGGNFTNLVNATGGWEGYVPAYIARIDGMLEQSITGFNALPGLSATETAYTITGVSGGASGNPVVFSSSHPLVATVSGNVIHVLQAGVTTITATQAGSGSYLSATPVSQVLVVTCPSADLLQPVAGMPVPVGNNFSMAFSISGFNAPATYSHVDNLPLNTALNSVTGLLSGVAANTALGISHFTVSGTTKGCTYERAYNLTLTCGTFGLSGSDSAFVTGPVGNALTLNNNVTGFLLPPTHWVGNGTIPSGIVLNTLTGSLTGTFTGMGQFNYSVRAVYGACQSTAKNYVFRVLQPVLSATVSGGSLITTPGGAITLASVFSPANANLLTLLGWNTTLNGLAAFNTLTGVLTALQQGNGVVYIQSSYEYGSVVSNIHAVTITNNLTPQTISFSSIPNQMYGNSLTLSGTATSGLAVAFNVQASSPSVFTLSGNVLTFTHIGTLTVTATQMGNSLFAAATPVTHVFSVLPRPLTITANNKSKFFLTANPPLDGNITGLLPGDTLFVNYFTDATLTSPVGLYFIGISVAGASMPKYNITTVAGVLTITSQTFPLTVMAGNFSRMYGDSNPLLTGTILGLQPNTTVTALYFTNATPLSQVGNYPVLISVGGANVSNYNILTIAGTLTVTKAPLTIVGANATRLYGKPNPTFIYQVFGLRNGDNINSIDVLPVGETSASLNTDAGEYAINFSGGTDNNYDFMYIPSSLLITAATQTLTGFSTRATLSPGQSITLSGLATSRQEVMAASLQPQIANILGRVITGVAEGQATIRIWQPGGTNYLASDTLTLQAIVTSTGVVATTTLGIVGSQFAGAGQPVYYSVPTVAGFDYEWIVLESGLVVRTVKGANLVHTFSAQSQSPEVTLNIFDADGNLVKQENLPVIVTGADIGKLADDIRPTDCSAQVTDCKGSFIKSFTIQKLTNLNSGCSRSGFGDFTASGKLDTLRMGNSYSAYVHVVSEYPAYYIGLWIDYNNNGSFDDAEDFLGSFYGTDSVVEVKNLIIKNDETYIGARRLRVTMLANGTIGRNSACPVSGATGETEDYLVVLRAQDRLEAPQLITPNNDGKNDLFVIRGINPKQGNRLTIFNRYGEVLFTKDNYENTWDGRDNSGKELLSGTYFYTFVNGNAIIRGYVEVLR